MFDLPLYVLIGAVCAGCSIPVLWWSVAAAKPETDVQNRLRVDNDLREIMLARGSGERVVQPGIQRLADIARQLSPEGLVERLDEKILMAGVGHRWPLQRVLGVKLLLGIGAGLLSLMRWAVDLTNGMALVLGLIFTAGMFFLPDLLIGIRGKQRQEEIARSLPDILDQMTISVEAGLGFDAALGHVATHVEGPLAEEIAHTLQDVKLGMTRNQAFENMVNRTDVPELRQFVLALQQAERLGTPIAQVLRVQSSELRTIRRQRAEEAAQKVPVKMIIPLVLLILPALIIIVLAPAVFEVIETF